MDSMMVGKSLKDRPVAPGPPWNSVSPLNTVPSIRAFAPEEEADGSG